MENYIDDLIKTHSDYIYLYKNNINSLAKQIYIELLKLEYPAATDTHRESLAKQAFLYAVEFHKATIYF